MKIRTNTLQKLSFEGVFRISGGVIFTGFPLYFFLQFQFRLDLPFSLVYNVLELKVTM